MLLPQVSLDLYIMREAADAFNQTGRMNTDWVAVVEEWAERFLVRYGRNGGFCVWITDVGHCV